jgi:hypothetical protein
VDFGNSLEGANGTALNQPMQYIQCFLFRDIHIAEELFAIFLEGLRAFVTTVALISLAVLPIPFRLDLTIVTRHSWKPCLSNATGSQLTLLESDASNRV